MVLQIICKYSIHAIDSLHLAFSIKNALFEYKACNLILNLFSVVRNIHKQSSSRAFWEAEQHARQKCFTPAYGIPWFPSFMCLLGFDVKMERIVFLVQLSSKYSFVSCFWLGKKKVLFWLVVAQTLVLNSLSESAHKFPLYWM